MKLLNLAMTALCFASLSGMAMAQAQGDDNPAPDKPGPWLVRVRGEGLIPLNHSAPFAFQGGNFYGYALHLDQKIAFEGDLSYFFNQNFAIEVSANAPAPQTANLATVGNLGTIDLVMPMIIAQYHLVGRNSPISPYIGLGLSWNHVQSQDFSQTGSLVSVTQDTSGYVIQIGLDFPVSHGIYVNLDFRHVQVIPNLKATSGGVLTDFNISPNIISIGAGYRF